MDTDFAAHTSTPAQLGFHIRALRQQSRLTPDELATRANVTPEVVQDLEAGRGSATVAEMLSVLATLRASLVVAPHDPPPMTLDEFSDALARAVDAGIVEEVCHTHDPLPMTESIEAELEAGHDPCHTVIAYSYDTLVELGV